MLRLAFDFIITWRETRTRPNAYNKNTPYDAPLQWNNRSYDTGIRTTDIRQTKFGSGEWQTVSGGFRMYFHCTLLIYSKIT